MACLISFLLKRRPFSAQTKNRRSLQSWKAFVRTEAERNWSRGAPIAGRALSIRLVYLCDDAPVDTDDIVKPIQDALVGVVYEDDTLVTDVHSHRRPFAGVGFGATALPALVLEGLRLASECVYVSVADAGLLEEELR